MSAQLIPFLLGKTGEQPDWRKLIEAAGDTLTIGILADRTLDRENAFNPPDAIRDLLADVRERAIKRNKLIRKQFEELVEALNGAGIEPIPMKGMARLLGSAESDCRLLSDIDILVPDSRREDCADAMRAIGYVATDDGDEPSPSVFSRPSDVGSVDLHTRLKPHYLGLDYDRIAPLCRRRQVASGAFLMPSPTCEALVLIAHDQLHDADYWRGLVDMRHLLDLRDLVEEGVEWPLLASHFKKGSSRTALEVAARTALAMADADVPMAFCGGGWSRLQVARRRFQARFPGLQPLLTVLTLAADPPPVGRSNLLKERAPESSREKLLRRRQRYLRARNPGKIAGTASPQRRAEAQSLRSPT